MNKEKLARLQAEMLAISKKRIERKGIKRRCGMCGKYIVVKRAQLCMRCHGLSKRKGLWRPPEVPGEFPVTGDSPVMDRIGMLRWFYAIRPIHEKHLPNRLVSDYEKAWEMEIERIAKLPDIPRMMAATALWYRMRDAKAVANAISEDLPISKVPRDILERRYATLRLTLANTGHAPIELDPTLIRKVRTVKGKTVITLEAEIKVEESKDDIIPQLGEVYRDGQDIDALLTGIDRL
jgi:hypothetical protein